MVMVMVQRCRIVPIFALFSSVEYWLKIRKSYFVKLVYGFTSCGFSRRTSAMEGAVYTSCSNVTTMEWNLLTSVFQRSVNLSTFTLHSRSWLGLDLINADIFFKIWMHTCVNEETLQHLLGARERDWLSGVLSNGAFSYKTLIWPSSPFCLHLSFSFSLVSPAIVCLKQQGIGIWLKHWLSDLNIWWILA